MIDGQVPRADPSGVYRILDTRSMNAHRKAKVEEASCLQLEAMTLLGYVPKLPKVGLIGRFRLALLILAGTIMAGLTIVWIALLLWLSAQAVIAVAHWF